MKPILFTDVETLQIEVATIENQITTLDEAIASNIRETIPSGFTTLSDMDYSYMSTNPNTIKLTSESVAFVNGYKTVIPAGTVITLNEPPKANYVDAQGRKGTRDDLVFLECWKQTGSVGVVTWNYRIRVVDGVDFVTYPMDGISATFLNANWTGQGNKAIAPQGALTSPISTPINYFLSGFRPCSNTSNAMYESPNMKEDVGLYVSGKAGYNLYNTSDGYVFAIPMFKINRRNDGGFPRPLEYQLLGAKNTVASGGILSQERVAHVLDSGNNLEILGNTSDIYGGVPIVSDFAGKVKGSTIENPNIYRFGVADSALTSPLISMWEANDGQSIGIKTINDSLLSIASSIIDKSIPQQVFSFDIVKIYERKFGAIPVVITGVPATDLASKIAWLKNNIDNFSCNWTGYGSCPNGSRGYLDVFSNTDNKYYLKGYGSIASKTNNTSSPTLLNWVLPKDRILLLNLIDIYGFIHFLAYTDMASTTSPTLLVLTGHGLVAGDITENTSRGNIIQYYSSTNVTSPNVLSTVSLTGQSSGDIIKKYRGLSSKIATTGTTSSNLVLMSHGLTTGDYIKNTTRNYAISKVNVVDANTLTLSTPITGQVSGDSVAPIGYIGQQTAEATVIPSTIFTDYISLDITLKPSYKSVGEDFGGSGVNKVVVKSGGKNKFNGNYDDGYIPNNSLLNSLAIAIGARTSKWSRCKTNQSYVISGNDRNVWQFKNSVGVISYVPSTNIVISPNDAYYVRVYYSSNGLATNFQLEEGTVATPYEPYKEDSREILLKSPLRRVSPTVADVYKEGQVSRNVSEWVALEGNISWTAFGYVSGIKNLASGSIINKLATPLLVIKHDGKVLVNTPSTLVYSDTCYINEQNPLYIRVPNVDSGWSDGLYPTIAEVKPYFLGYKMCHSDGVSPYQVSEVPYNPSTWAEWTKPSGVVGDSTGLEFTANGNILGAPYIMTVKPLTKYALLYNVISSNLDGSLLGASSSRGVGFPYLSKKIGNNKSITTSNAINLDLGAVIYLSDDSTVGTKIKLKDIRLFELPTGSQIETDFNTLDADQLALKYLFYGLNPKNWKSVVDGSGLTSTLPTAQAPNYTPYKMLYQLATPTVEKADLAWMYSNVGVNNYSVESNVPTSFNLKIGAKEVLGAVDNATLVLEDNDVTYKKNFNGGVSKASGVSGRPDGMYSDVVVERDLYNLRHQVSLTGFSYQSLLEESFDKLLRGEL